MILLVCLAVAAATIPVTGGRFAGLGDVDVRAAPVLLVSCVMQVLLFAPWFPDAIAPAVHLASYAGTAAFVVANRRLPGMLAAAAGGALNLAAIAANGGVMPAAPAALRLAGLAANPEGFANSAAVAAPRLAFLGDVFAIPQGLPFANVFSVGDLILVAGGSYALHRLAGGSLRRRVSVPAS